MEKIDIERDGTTSTIDTHGLETKRNGNAHKEKIPAIVMSAPKAPHNALYAMYNLLEVTMSLEF
jgi:hypothetical protein